MYRQNILCENVVQGVLHHHWKSRYINILHEEMKYGRFSMSVYILNILMCSTCLYPPPSFLVLGVEPDPNITRQFRSVWCKIHLNISVIEVGRASKYLTVLKISRKSDLRWGSESYLHTHWGFRPRRASVVGCQLVVLTARWILFYVK